MPLEFESEEDLNNAILPQESQEEEEDSGPIVFESEADFQANVEPESMPQEMPMQPQAQPMQPQMELPPLAPQGLNPGDLASAVLGNAVQQPQAAPEVDRKTIIDSYGSRGNTLAQKLPAGVEAIHPADLEGVTQALSSSFMSMSSTGIILDPMERAMYATSVMENTGMRADVRAQLIDQAMRDGKILPEALPRSWYEARGLSLLPANLDLEAAKKELR
jgi:hypothetical protein